MRHITQKEYIAIAIPFTVSMVTQPLLGAVDTAVVGRLPSPAFIGGVAIGTVIFNTLYWLFGFLRMATTGFAAQSLGENSPADLAHIFLRPLTVAVGVGLIFLLCQSIIIKGAMAIYQAEPDVAAHATTYFSILIWGAPLVLIGYVNLGWLMGRGHVREVLILQIGANGLNIILDFIFVLIFHLGVIEIAVATLISQGLGFLLGLYLILGRMPVTLLKAHFAGVFDARAMKKLALVNGDLLIRIACLLTMTNIFVAKGSSMGADFLAANAILFQIQYLMAFLFGGLANATSVFSGKFAGSGNLEGFKNTNAISILNLTGLGLLLAAGLLLFETPLLRLFTDIEPVLEICRTYQVYLLLYILAMGPGLVYGGFYTGATYTGPIRNSTVFALIVFLPLEVVLIPRFHNHGLWTAFILFCAVRSAVLLISWRKMINSIFHGQVPNTKRVPC
jgi:MATE family multidrug resistance protein